MSLIKSLTKRNRLNAAIKTVAQARQSEGGKADQLFLKAYDEFWDTISDDLVLSKTLYNWGFALLQQGKSKPQDVAIPLYEQAIKKFEFCLTIEPHFLGAAIDGGVTMMELARIKAVDINDPLYHAAKAQFILADKIQKGSAIYNFACISALMGDDEACLQALKDAVDYGSLPNKDEVLNDPDLDKVKSKTWFIEFIESLKELSKQDNTHKSAAIMEKEAAAKEAESKGTDEPELSEAKTEVVTETETKTDEE